MQLNFNGFANGFTKQSAIKNPSVISEPGFNKLTVADREEAVIFNSSNSYKRAANGLSPSFSTYAGTS